MLKEQDIMAFLEQADLKSLCNTEELIIKLKEKKKKEQAKELTSKLKELVRDSGVDIKDLLVQLAEKQVGKPDKPKTSVKPKYRNPKDFNQTWSGRGIPPPWAKVYKDKGKLAEIEIKESI